MKNCGILFNSKNNAFEKYLEFIYNESKSSTKFKISGIHTNPGCQLPDFIDDENIYSSAEKIFSSSDIVFSLGYWKIITEYQISQVPIGIVNFHHSHRLKYKGRHCATWAIRNKETAHGTTMHFIDQSLDAGKIIESRSYDIENYDTAEDLFYRSNDLGLEILKDNFDSLILGDARIDNLGLSEDFFTYKEKDLDHEINSDLIKDKEKFIREIRAITFNKKPAPFLKIDGQTVYLKLSTHDSGILKKHD